MVLLVCIGLLSVAIGGAFGLEAEQQQQEQGGRGEGAVSPGDDGGKVVDAPSGSASSREPERRSAQSEGRKFPHPAPGAGDGTGGFNPALVGGIIAAVVIGGAGAYFLLFAGEGKKKFKGDAVFLIGPSGGWVNRPNYSTIRGHNPRNLPSPLPHATFSPLFHHPWPLILPR